jgi:hypothetical protein
VGKYFEDGNILGRIGALLFLAGMAFLLARICGVGAVYCPMGASGADCVVIAPPALPADAPSRSPSVRPEASPKEEPEAEGDSDPQ